MAIHIIWRVVIAVIIVIIIMKCIVDQTKQRKQFDYTMHNTINCVINSLVFVIIIQNYLKMFVLLFNNCNKKKYTVSCY